MCSAQALHEFEPSEAFTRRVESQIEEARKTRAFAACEGRREGGVAGDALEALELSRMRNHLNEYFDRRRVLGRRVLSSSTPLWKVLGRSSLRRFPHLVHYGGNYFCYLFCRATAALALSSWRAERGVAQSLSAPVDEPFFSDWKQRQRLKALLGRGSSDCSVDALLSLFPDEGPGSVNKALLRRQPEMLPLEALLEEAGASS